MSKKENIINFDGKGSPEYKMSIKDILKQFGAVLNPETNKWEIENDKKLDITPKLSQDNGVGYDAERKYLIRFEADKNELYYDVVLPSCKLFVKYDLYPGVFFSYNNKEYTINDIVTKKGKDYAVCVEWLYDGSVDFKGPFVGKQERIDMDIVVNALKA